MEMETESWPPAEVRRKPRLRWWVTGAIALVVVVTATVVVVMVNRHSGGPPSGKFATPIQSTFEPRGACDPDSYRLDTFDAPMSVTGVSPNGEYIVGVLASTSGLQNGFVLWHNGKTTTVKNPAPDTEVNAPQVNDSGVVVGSGDSATRDTPWRYVDGKVEMLKPPDDLPKGSLGTDAVYIANDGTIAGFSSRYTGEESMASTPYLWAPGTTTAKRLQLPKGGPDADVTGISTDGTILGTVYDSDTLTGPWIWSSDGTGRRVLADKSSGATGDAIAGDWVLITTHGGERYDRVNYRDGHEYEALDISDAVNATPYGFIDNHGVLFGLSTAGDFSVLGTHPHRLPGVPDAPRNPDEGINEMGAVSQDGKVVVGTEWQHSQLAVWTCR